MPLRSTSFTAGTHSWVVPFGVTGIWVNAIAGGGGGAGGNSLPSHAASGGGSGGWCMKVLMSVVSGETLTISVGNGGAGGIHSSNAGASGAGQNGGDSSVSGSLKTISVSGGRGASGILNNGGPETSLSGKGGNGFLGGASQGENTVGVIGKWFGPKHGYGGGSSGGGVGADGGPAQMNGWGMDPQFAYGVVTGGGGAASIYGLGGAVQTGFPTNTAGNPAPVSSYGAGGSGPSGNGTLGSIAKDGGAGARGRVDIFWIGA